MAQTTDGFSIKDAKVEISTDGSSWTNVSGFSAGISVGGGQRNLAEEYTHDGDTAIITAGKRAPIDVTFKAIYTEGGSDPYETMRAVYEAGSDFYIRFSAKAGASGDFLYTSPAGKIQNLAYPQGDSNAADPLTVEAVIRVASLTKSVIA